MVKEITIEEFQNFLNKSPMSSHYQTINYALLMGEYGYDYEFIGYFNDYNNIKAVSLILFKKINNKYKYGYAPRGFILDYFNKDLMKEFTIALKNYYKSKKVIFIKLNPNIAISEIDTTNYLKTYNFNFDIREILENNTYLKLKDNLYFESVLPRFQAIVPLRNFDLFHISKNGRNKVRKAESKGLHIELANKSGIDILNNFIKKKRYTSEYYYKDYYSVFEKDNNVDLFLVSINSQEYLLNSRNKYEETLELNNNYNNMLNIKNNKKIINIKMNSDKELNAYKSDVLKATEMNKDKDIIYIAGALIVKHKNRIQIIISGYDTKYKDFDPNYFLHYKILEYYKDKYDYADLNGITGDFSKTNPYYGLNKFKLEFRPRIYEYIGEYDLPINTRKYLKLRKLGILTKEFKKKNIKK